MDITYNSHCYTFESIEREKGFLDEAVDVTYIIHLEGNGRWDHIVDQLRTYVPSQHIYIVKNKGVKRCNKRLPEQETYTDLTDAFLQCFHHAKAHHYGNILILEDDFIFNPVVLSEPEHVKAVGEFVQTHNNEAFYYHLGCMPILIYPEWRDWRTYRCSKSFCTHATIYSKKMVEDYEQFDTTIPHWDMIISKRIKNRYLYYKPLCYQTFPNTDNKNEWHKIYGNFIQMFVVQYMHLLGLDEKPQPGFSITYGLSKALSFSYYSLPVILVLFLFLFYYTSKPRGGR